jgi:hypothetical protein
MSDTGKTADQVQNENPAAELFARYEKKGKVVCLANDDQEAFVSFTDMLGAANYQDWTKGAPENMTGLAMVQSESKVNRLIAIANEETALADPVVRKALYRIYVNRVANAAEDNDANPAAFLVTAGNFKLKFDLDAFKFQAKVLTKFLRSKGLAGVTNNSLRMSFASAAFAKTQFPRISDDGWNKIIAIAEKNAENKGMDTSIFDHWKATRAVQTADTSEIALDFGELEEDVDAIGTDGEETKGTTAAS